MKTNGNDVCAIIDTGSQLDVVRADVAALKIQKAVDMSQVTNMNDANGGRGQLQGWIRDVEFTCGAATTMTNLWVSQKAPFALLLGRPWQRGNLVSIDEWDEGTYLIFKDRETRRPRFELLAVPYEGSLPLQPGSASQYQLFSILTDNDSRRNSWMTPDERDFVGRVAQIGKTLGEASRDIAKGNFLALRDTILENISGNESIKGPLTSNKGRKESLVEAGLQLAQAALGAFVVVGALVVYRQFRTQWWSQKSPIYKEHARAPFLYQPLSFSAMSLPRSLSDSVLVRDNGYDVRPLEDVQYLSRARFSRPPMPVATLNTSGPIATVEDAVARQWQKYAAHQPLDVDPTFMVAPQSEYYGSVVLPSGQVLHRSSSHNVFRVFWDRVTGRPFTLSCHEFNFHIVTPDDPQQVWRLELCYPSDKRLQQAMATMTPPNATDQDDIGFPVHASPQAPPMIHLSERMQVNQHSPDMGTTAESVIRDSATTLSPRLLLIPDELADVAEPLPTTHGSVEAVLSEDIRQRAAAAIKRDIGDLFGTDSDSDGSMPELRSISPDSGGFNSSTDLGLCGLCFE
jgi:tetrahydromethanopterin S-methyltransferase subunit G